MIKSVEDSVWFYKYAPKTLDELVLKESIKNKIESYRKTKSIPNILLIGRAGIGKTSLAKIIVNDVLGCQYRYINAGDENGIDTIRTKVIDFAETKGFDGRKKVIILDEASNITPSAQEALKNVMESLDTVSFILTGNHSHRICEAVKSRCQEFNLNFTMKEYAKRILWILSNEKVKYEKDFILKKIKTFYPDFRKRINELEKYAIDGEILESNVEDVTIAQDIFNKVQSDTSVYDLRSFILSNHDKFSSDYEYLTELIFNLVCKSIIPENKKAKILIELSDCIKNYSSVVNPEINFSAAMLKIREII